MLRTILLLVFVLVAKAPVTLAHNVQEEPFDLVLWNGRIVTVDDSPAEVGAIGILGDRIAALGSREELASRVGESTRVIDLAGRLAVPGFIEGHAHFLGIGEMKLQLDLMTVRSWEEIVALVADAAKRAKPGELIRGRGWHQEKWDRLPKDAVDGLPVHTALSAVSPRNPVLLTHASGHATFANARAMEMCNISGATEAPPGGEIVLDANGDPIGVFRETAAALLFRARQGHVAPDPERVVELATQEVLSKGVTSFHDAGSSFEDAALLSRMAIEGRLGVRVWMMLRESVGRLRKRLPELPRDPRAKPFFVVGGIKRSIDGALGSHGAWLLEPYTDLPESSGLNTVSVEEVEEVAQIALEHELQLCVHAIGDRANRETLDIFERAFRANPDKRDLRWRIEHAQHLHPDDIARFAQLGVLACVQGVHCTSDGPWVPERLGEKRSREGAYVWRDLIDSGAILINGTDAPVEDVDPLASFRATVTRRTKDGSLFYPDQRMTRMEALRSYTRHAAYAAFQEKEKGTLAVGKLADITVISHDILQLPDDELGKAKIDATIVGGVVAFER